jgi:hypothetical protein
VLERKRIFYFGLLGVLIGGSQMAQPPLLTGKMARLSSERQVDLYAIDAHSTIGLGSEKPDYDSARKIALRYLKSH